MRKIIGVAAIAMLAACSQAETEAEPEAVEEVVVEVTAADGGPAYGTYKVTLPDGGVVIDEVHPDGTYSATLPDGTVETGTWVQKAPDTYCTTRDEEGATERCSTETVGEDGVWTSVNPEGETVTVERVVEEAAEAE